MNLIEKLIEAEIEFVKEHYDVTRPHGSTRLTDLRNALQEYREMLKAVCEHYIIKSEKYKGLNVCSKCGIYKPERQMPISPLKNPD